MTPNAPRGTRHTVAPIYAGSDIAAIRATITARILAETDTMSGLAERKPTCTDGHSDGVRVRYVRAETTAAILSDILAALDGVA